MVYLVFSFKILMEAIRLIPYRLIFKKKKLLGTEALVKKTTSLLTQAEHVIE